MLKLCSLLVVASLFSCQTAFAADLIDPKQAIELKAQESKVFFEKNKKKKNIKTFASGLQIKVIKEGKGNHPDIDDYVKINYRATFLNGQEFDSSDHNKPPKILQISAAMPGLKEALRMMKPGAEWVIYIPCDLAYGAEGIEGKVPPNSSLVFYLTLQKIIPAPDESMSSGLEDLREK